MLRNTGRSDGGEITRLGGTRTGRLRRAVVVMGMRMMERRRARF